MAAKESTTQDGDPVDHLRRGWDLHVEFGISHPTAYVLTYGPGREGRPSPAYTASYRHLVAAVERTARVGRLQLPVEAAARMVRAGGVGVTLTLIAMPPEERDPAMSVRMREMVLSAITTDDPPAFMSAAPSAASHAVPCSLPPRRPCSANGSLDSPAGRASPSRCDSE